MQYIPDPDEMQRIPAYYRSEAWRKLRNAVLMRDGCACRYCGAEARMADHVVPRRRGGADALDNLVACCAPCNKAAGNLLFPSLDAKRDHIRKARRLDAPGTLLVVSEPKTPKPRRRKRYRRNKGHSKVRG